ncbi:hypothetical protein Taro_030733 [Colocasia esculenta]|uniref:U-box domain-containing protein n=1 Tax=Colocasia esculenta TaxID=4460 RepID=A0A843VSQ1_COLES|nr:hypothetical protein [Colocasia esculenta]
MGGRRGNGREELDVNVPSFFRCPISLDVMKSPVSLCTGVTYDRSSIQTWLDTGHNTCPATMQVLPTTDFVPNHTLHRLIQLWFAQSRRCHRPQSASEPAACSSPRDLLRGLADASSGDSVPLLRRIAEAAEDAARVRELAEDGSCVSALNGILVRGGLGLEAMEAVARALSSVLVAQKEGGGAGFDKSLADLRTVSSLLAVVKDGNLEGRIAAARVLEAIASSGAENKLLVAGTEGMLAALLRLVGEEEEGKPLDSRALDAGLSCLVAVSSPRRVRPQMVRAGVVPVLGKLLARPSTPQSASEKALKLMETASTCTDGRVAICEDPATVAAIVGKMMKVSAAGTEHAVVVLWSVCHLFRDRRAQEAVAASNGLTKVLLLMQSNCSPAARQMAGDLLKVFRVGSKSCLPSYDCKTTHIMPF